MKAELGDARRIFEQAINQLNDTRSALKENCTVLSLSSVILFIRYHCRVTNGEITARHQKKLEELAIKQQKIPLRIIKSTVGIVCDINPLQYVLHLLSCGSKHPIRGKIVDMNLLTNVDLLLSQNTDADICNDLNAMRSGKSNWQNGSTGIVPSPGQWLT